MNPRDGVKGAKNGLQTPSPQLKKSRKKLEKSV